MRWLGLVCSSNGYRTPPCSMAALIRRTPCGFAIRTPTGVDAPITFTAGSMVIAVGAEDIMKNAIVPTIAKRSIAMIAFTV